MDEFPKQGKFKVTLAAPLKFSQTIDQLVELEGTAIKEGQYTGIDGHTIYWPKETITKMHEEFVGKPLIQRHTGEDNKVTEVACGYVKGMGMDGPSAVHQSVVYNPMLFPKILSGEIDAVSPEIDVTLDWSPQLEAYVAKEGHPTALCLTNNPACKAALISDSHYVTQVRMELLGDIKDKTKETKHKMSDNSNNSAAVAWENLSDDEKLKRVQKFCDEKGYAMVSNKQQMEQGKEIASMKGQLEALNSIVAGFQTTELTKLEAEIKEIDADFNTKVMMEAKVDFPTKKVMLESALQTLGRVGKVKMQLGEPGRKGSEETEKAKLEASEKNFIDQMSPELKELIK